MAQRSRKRRARRARTGTGPAPKAPAQPKVVETAAARRRRTARDEAPPAPWGTFPLVELITLLALVTIVAGFFIGGERGVAMIGVGLVAGSAAGVELAFREHLAGYRSHTLLLSGLAAVLVMAILFVAAPDSLPIAARLGTAVAAFALAAWRLTALFRNRSGGHSFRIVTRR